MTWVGQRVLVAAGLLLSIASAIDAAVLSIEVADIRVELTSDPSRPGTKGYTEYVVRVVDRAGKPVTGAQVSLRGGMADGMSVVAPLPATAEPGTYRGRLLFTMEGKWKLTLRLAREGTRFEIPLTEEVGR